MITLKEFFSFKKNRFFWLNLIAIIVVIIGVCWGTLLWLDSYTHHGEAYMVPNVKNKTLNEAQQATQQPETERAGYRLQLCERCARRHGTGSKSGRRSTREGGKDNLLTVTTSKVPLVKLPDLIDNSSLRQAEAKLKAMGFKLTEPEYVSGEQDWIYGIKYRGRSLASGDKVPHEAC